MVEPFKVGLGEAARAFSLLHRHKLFILRPDHRGKFVRAQRLLPNLRLNDRQLSLLLRSALLIDVNNQLELLLDFI